MVGDVARRAKVEDAVYIYVVSWSETLETKVAHKGEGEGGVILSLSHTHKRTPYLSLTHTNKNTNTNEDT